jgi:hypothetical protein
MYYTTYESRFHFHEYGHLEAETTLEKIDLSLVFSKEAILTKDNLVKTYIFIEERF